MHSARRNALSASTLLALLSASTAAAPLQADVPAPCPTGPPTPLCYGDVVACTLNFTSQTDGYVFFGRQGEQIEITVSGRSFNLDPQIELWAAGTQQMLPTPTACSANSVSLCSFATTYVLPMDAEYFLFVSDAGGDNAGGYEVNLERIVPEHPVPEAMFGSPMPLIMTIDYACDHDWARFDVDPGSIVRIVASGRTFNLDPAFVLYDSAGTQIDWTSCSANSVQTCTATMTTTALAAGGTYYLKVYDAGWNNTGQIDVGVQCLFSPLGSCPTPSPDDPIGTSYCTSQPNSGGVAATIHAVGSLAIDRNRVHLRVDDVPSGTFGVFFLGPNPAAGTPISGSQGLLCVDNPLVRFRAVKACHDGVARERIDTMTPIQNLMPTAGGTLHFQFWYRDGTSSNTSDGLQLTFV